MIDADAVRAGAPTPPRTAGGSAPVELYERGLAAAGGCRARFSDGSVQVLQLARWVGAASSEEAQALERLEGPVLDVGCGAGRHVMELQRRGVSALGVDVAPAAVRLARERGAAALRRSVFARIPGEGLWGGALLLDGNVGIGGDPVALLRRVGGLLRPGGRVLVELDPPPVRSGPLLVRLESRELGGSSWFPWARLGPDALASVAGEAGLRTAGCWEATGRWFACLDAPGARGS